MSLFTETNLFIMNKKTYKTLIHLTYLKIINKKLIEHIKTATKENMKTQNFH